MQKNSGANTTKAKDRKRNLKRSTVPFDEVLRSELQDREIAIGYINTLLSEEDEQGVLLALRDIADAMSIGAVAKVAGVNRESLYKMLSGRRDPRFSTVLKVLQGLGIKLRALDARIEIGPALKTSRQATAPEAFPKAGSFIRDLSAARQTVRMNYPPPTVPLLRPQFTRPTVEAPAAAKLAPGSTPKRRARPGRRRSA
jgi:probable addiction module antidote protein